MSLPWRNVARETKQTTTSNPPHQSSFPSPGPAAELSASGGRTERLSGFLQASPEQFSSSSWGRAEPLLSGERHPPMAMMRGCEAALQTPTKKNNEACTKESNALPRVSICLHLSYPVPKDRWGRLDCQLLDVLFQEQAPMCNCLSQQVQTKRLLHFQATLTRA